MASWPPWVTRGVVEVEQRFDLKGATYRGHADGDPGHDMSGDRAADFWTTSKAKHDQVLNWFTRDNFANARRFGMTYIISWRRIASVGRASEGVRAYTRYGPDAGASQAHTNHVHISWGNTPPAHQEDDDLPSANEVADAVLTRDGKIENVWNPASPNKFLQLASAIEELGKDGNRIEASVKALNAEVAALKKTLAAIALKVGA